ncbi:toll/interleukin-1 receptor domain-containing protein [Clostridium tyrobutyricum]|uniref:toll/interleukin-1 receptor domain-containing protein n=1 Tax=Clostridium tyrobutyricum TaxID=1519 RepID=UPI001C3952E8|nr:toll/interleukin-1 receptor domain-containing protein [Clostridium tyrobutyricum]MBV4420178.1 toll/interleukin-1 receptor domain-containing protein [Clostridium tyrobutyricum]
MVNMFVSYCQKDSVYADNIDLYFKDKDVNVRRDARDISQWKSIREYMKTIRNMDYAILIVTDNYLKSFNCMYEVLEVMKEKDYENKIFPAVVESSIYSAGGRIPYIKYWEDKFNELRNQISEIDVVNAGSAIDDLKKTQSIRSSIDEFLAEVSDMNNPDVSNINLAIENKLKDKGLLGDNHSSITGGKSKIQEKQDFLSKFDFTKVNLNSVPTDFEKDEFMTVSFESINKLLKEIFRKVERENSSINVKIETLNSKTNLYKFYKNGSQVRVLKLFLGNLIGMGSNNIFISCENYSLGNNSYNGMISLEVTDGKMALKPIMGFSFSQNCESVEDITLGIWKTYVYPYLLN